MQRRWIVCSLILAVTLTYGCVYAEPQPDNITNRFESMGIVQGSASATYSFLALTFRHDSYGTRIYPRHYAGAYALNNGYLVIQLTDISSEATAFYTNHLGPDARVIFEQVDFSYNQLTSFGNTFMEVVDSPIVGFGLRTMENTFNVTLDYQSPRSVEVYEAINEFRRLVPIPIDVRLGELDVILPLTIY